MLKKKLNKAQGFPKPLGPSKKGAGWNFSLYTETEKTPSLLLFECDQQEPFAIFEMCQTKGIWHIYVENLPEKFDYTFSIDGKWICDPYAKALNTPTLWLEKKGTILGRILSEETFDWGKSHHPNIPVEKLIIYEMHVRGFTKKAKTLHQGTFLGIKEQIPYLKELGVNALELMPIFEFNELGRESLPNYWGYSPMSFFAPMARYSDDHPIQEFKEMVRALHESGIEVILDVVFNHSGEESLKILGKNSYFLVNEHGDDFNFSGCGNTLNCNHPMTLDLILDSLRYWVCEMHVDGFRFDLASIFCRGENGKVLDAPSVIDAINSDPLLGDTKLIAEPWDCGGLYQVGSFPGKGKWAEWNGKFRDIVRRFLKGTDGQSGAFASVMAGSSNLYQKPFQSVNFVTAHDGFTLRDLVSYNEKHNEENKENNADGNDFNESWNCGSEGPTEDPAILALRERQMRNFFMALFLSIGTPMLLMGDEYGHSRFGNNNAYCQDNEKNFFLWEELKKHQARFAFVKRLIVIRKKRPTLQRKDFLSDDAITWHGHQPHQPDWSQTSRFVAYELDDLYIAFNAHFETAHIHLPEGKWKCLIDTENLSKKYECEKHHEMLPYNSILLQRI